MIPEIHISYFAIWFMFMGIMNDTSWDRVVGIATSYGLDDRGVGVRVPVGLGPTNLLSNGYRGLFPWG
jgi:hypothetical protein